jgi:hypothetical protein
LSEDGVTPQRDLSNPTVSAEVGALLASERDDAQPKEGSSTD